ncbi:MAG: MATE family efflux transporter [Myxococcales bacterium]|nr:MATE family efflux transporter [Myxococcales bacterium]
MRSSDSIVRPLLGLALPYAVSGLFGVLNIVIDRFWVGKVGTNALAALGTAQSILMVMMTVLMGMAIGTLAGVARSVGEEKSQETSRFAAGGVLVGFALGCMGLLAGFLYAPDALMHVIDAEAAVRLPATSYLRISMWGLSLLGPLFAIIYALQGAGDARRSLVLASVSPLTNAILDPILIFGFDLGMPGAAWATVAANGVGLAVGLVILRRRGGFLRGAWQGDWLSARVIRRIVAVGLPGSLEHLVRTVAGALLVYLLTPFGASVVSAYTAGTVLVMLAIFPGLSLGQATAALVGQNLGASRPERAWQTAWVSVAIYLALMIACGALYSAFPAQLIGVFDDNPEVLREGTRYLRIFSCSFPFIAVSLTLSKAFAGAGNTKPPMIAAAIAHLAVQIPLVWYLAHHFASTGAYIGMSIAFVVHASASAMLFIPRFRPRRHDLPLSR